MATAPNHLSPEDAHREAAHISEALAKVGLSESGVAEWWSRVDGAALGGRTPSDAWFAGDYAAVKAVVERLVSERFAAALSARPEVAQRLLEAPRSP